MWRTVSCIAAVSVVALTGCISPQTKMPEVSSVAEKAEAEKQRELALREIVEARRRLHGIGHRLLRGAVSLCEDRRYDIGVRLWSATTVNDDWKAAAKSAFGLGKEVTVSAVAPESPAGQAGLLPGDTFRRIGGWAVPQDMTDPEDFTDKLKELTRKGEPIDLIVQRKGARAELSLTPHEICDYDVKLSRDGQINAFADGSKITVTTGMMDFTRSDLDLAVVVGHELAHNAMGHSDAKTVNQAVGAAPGLVLDVLAAIAGVNTQGQFTKIGMSIGAQAYSVEFEQEADYVGLYSIALSGFDLATAPNLWRRMAAKNPTAITFRESHPTTPERFLALEETVDEIQLKVAEGRPLAPEIDESGGSVVVQTDSPDGDAAAFTQ